MSIGRCDITDLETEDAMTEYRYIYTRHTTVELACRTLEDMFATGEISEGEKPQVERRGWHWCITLVESA
jgi:hypothetical protein